MGGRHDHGSHDGEEVSGSYKRELRALQVELVKLQKHVIAHGDRILVLLEGRDAAGKDGAIKRVVQHLSPRETRVVALGKPSDRERSEWYFQRWVEQLPAASELVLFNRSWYNRAGVERVMGFCTAEEVDEFLEAVPIFEQLLLRDGIRLHKYYLDITRAEQERRMADRRSSPLTQWKISPVDEKAVKLWKEYSEARDAMLARTHSVLSPWTILRADDKKRTRLELIKHLLLHQDYDGKDDSLLLPDPDLVFPYAEEHVASGHIAR